MIQFLINHLSMPGVGGTILVIYAGFVFAISRQPTIQEPEVHRWRLGALSVITCLVLVLVVVLALYDPFLLAAKP